MGWLGLPVSHLGLRKMSTGGVVGLFFVGHGDFKDYKIIEIVRAKLLKNLLISRSEGIRKKTREIGISIYLVYKVYSN